MHKLILCGLAALALLAAGCSDDDDSTTPDPCDELAGLPFPGSAEQSVLNFQTIHENRDYTAYLELLDPTYQMFLKQETVLEFGMARDFFDYTEDLAITENMFSGVSPASEVGSVFNIEFPVFSQIDAWHDTEREEFPGTREARFDVNIRVFLDLPDGTTKLVNITGRLVFFVSAEELEWCGRTTNLYRLAGLVDETGTGGGKGAAGVEEVSWGSLKALFSTPVAKR